MTLNKNTYPYFDDYTDSKKYYQILFRPGIAVQSRELIQLQSILQNQINKFGSSIFKEGSMVIPGEMFISTNTPYIKLQNQFNSSNISVSNFLNKQIIGRTSGAVATVTDVVSKELTDPNTLYVTYKTGSSAQSFTGTTTATSKIITGINIDTSSISVGSIVSGTGIPSNTYISSINSSSQITLSNAATASGSSVSLTSTTTDSFIDGEQIDTITTGSEVVYSALLATTGSTGVGSKAVIRNGVYYINGYFCLVEEQTLILDKYSNTPSYKIGLRYTDQFITEEDDISLNDPATGSTNYSAPGAHRYFIDTVLSKYSLTEVVPANFVQLAVVDEGIIQTIVNKTEYSEIEKTLARRTFDESGDYTVRAFPLQIKEHLNTTSNFGLYTALNGGDDNKFVYSLEPGKAYVKGYEIEKQSTTYIASQKPRTTITKQNQTYNASLGSYVTVDSLTGTFDLTSLQSVNLYSATNAGGSVVGTAKIRSQEFVSGTPGNSAAVYKLWLFDVTMSSGSFSSVRSIGTSATSKGNLILVDSQAVLFEASNQIPILPFPEYAIKTFKDSSNNVDITYSVKRYHTGTMSGSSITLTAGSNEVFESYDVLSYHLSITTASGTATGNGYSAGSIINLGGAGNSVVLGGSPIGKQVTINVPSIAGSTVKIISSVAKTGNQQKTKTLTSRIQSGVSHSSTIQLDRADVYDIVSIIDDTTSANITSKYTLDNGQRDSYYDRGSLKFVVGNSVPASTVTINYRYFEHGSGDYFSVDSYNGVIAYKDIPSYQSSTGAVYSLINSLDFRPRINNAGTGFSVLSEIVVSDNNITADYEVYLPRKDKIFLDYKGNFVVSTGVPGINPQLPSDISNAMVLYEVSLNPYVFDTADITIKPIDNRRYTMRDIGKLDKRISNLEYYTSLSLLEKNTSDLFIDDGTGVNRFKNGFVVDNFKSHIIGDAALLEYKCAIDKENGILRPQFKSSNVAMNYSPSKSSNVTKTGDLLTLPYTVVSYINQPSASKTENINPYDVINWTGVMTLSPNSDDWYDTEQLPDIIIEDDDGQADALASLNGQVIWNDWVTTWAGQTLSSSTTSTSISESTYNSMVSDGTSASSVNKWGHVPGTRFAGSTYSLNRTTEVKEVGQSRTGSLLSVVESTNTQVIDNKVLNTSLIPYIRSKDIVFNVKALKPNTTVYPFFDGINVLSYTKPLGGSLGSPLVTDSAGEVSGIFSIPNNSSIKFRTGQRILRLTDSDTNTSFASSTSADGLYTATGVLQSTQKTILSTRTAQLVTSTVSEDRTSVESITSDSVLRTKWADPLAQTFLVNSEGGVFLCKINIFFASKDSKNIPVRLQIRNTVNGYPGQYVVPFSEVVLDASDVLVSADSSVATSFTFPSPVYLQDGTEYCFVLLSNSVEYNIWVSKTGEFNILTGERISKQPYAGVLFKSQNASTWTADQEEDIKFEIFNCQFSTSVVGSAILENSIPSSSTLISNPLYTVSDSNSTIVTVIHANHGFKTGNTVTLSGIVGTQNGISASVLNGSHVVTVLDMDSYTFQVSSVATSTGSCGGSSVVATQNIVMDVGNFNAQTLVFPGTSLGTSIKTRNLGDTLDSSYTDINVSENIVFTEPRIIYSDDNNTDIDVIIRNSFATSNPNISPVVDLQRSSLITVSNRINNNSTDELDPRSGDAIARYITKRVVLNDPATSLRVYLTAIRDNTATIKVYAKYLADDNQSENFDDQSYVEMTALTYPAFNSESFKDYTFEINNISPFSIFAIKVVMLSLETSDAPQIKDFRAIALAT